MEDVDLISGWASLVAQTVKRLPTMQETRVRSLGREDFPGEAKWQPAPVLLPGKSHGWRSLVGCSPWGREQSGTTERLHFTFHFYALEKEMATHSITLAWKLPRTEEPGRLQSMGSQRVGHN